MIAPGTGVAASLVIVFGRGGNADAFARQGFHADEARHRWSGGASSVLVLPPFAPSRAFTLTIDGAPVALGGARRTLSLEFNGVSLGEASKPEAGGALVFSVPGEIVDAAGVNTLIAHHSYTVVPAQIGANAKDTRELAFCWRRLAFEPAACVSSVVVAFGRGGNSDAFVREGWYDSEAQHRWTAGERSVLALPPMAPSPMFALTLDCAPLRIGGVRQTLEAHFNGVSLGAAAEPVAGAVVFEVPGELVSAERENRLALHHPQAMRPNEHTPENRDSRSLAFMVRRLEIAPDAPLPARGGELLLPEADVDALDPAAVASAFQSLGQNCEFGLFQRRCGVEPIGLLRFANISPERLVAGLRARFEGIADPEQLSFKPAGPQDMYGVHAVYGLHYHTFKAMDAIDMATFKPREARRLGYLARLLIEQIENNEKIFVRRGGYATRAEIRSLWRLLRSFHPAARLFVVQEASDAALQDAGRVAQLAPGLYCGSLPAFANPERVVSTLPFADWLKLCGAVYAHERGPSPPAESR